MAGAESSPTAQDAPTRRASRAWLEWSLGGLYEGWLRMCGRVERVGLRVGSDARGAGRCGVRWLRLRGGLAFARHRHREMETSKVKVILGTNLHTTPTGQQRVTRTSIALFCVFSPRPASVSVVPLGDGTHSLTRSRHATDGAAEPTARRSPIARQTHSTQTEPPWNSGRDARRWTLISPLWHMLSRRNSDEGCTLNLPTPRCSKSQVPLSPFSPSAPRAPQRWAPCLRTSEATREPVSAQSSGAQGEQPSSESACLQEPPYMADWLVESPFSKCCVAIHVEPILAVTASLMRVVVSLGPYGRSQQFVCPHALRTSLSFFVKETTAGGAFTDSGSWFCGLWRLSGWKREYVAW